MIQFNLQKKLHAVDGEMLLDIKIAIEQGQFSTIYGKSGAGKTSILRMIAGLMDPEQGEIKINNQVWYNSKNKINLSPQQRKIGFVFQDYSMFPNMTVKQNLQYALDKGQDNKIIQELIETIELHDLQNTKSNFLSGGQKQRVALARALVRKPEILLLDEPLSALDTGMRNKLQDYILKVHDRYNLTTILVSHDVSEVVKMSDKIFIIDQGKITRQGNPIDIFTNKSPSGQLNFVGKIIKIEKEKNTYITSLLIDKNIVKISTNQSDGDSLKIGDQIIVTTETLNPIIRKIEG